MTHLEPRLELALESARMAREPSAADRARNLAALEARLGIEPVVSGTDSGRGAATVAAGGKVLKWSALKWKLAALGVVTGAVGFLVGLELGRRASPVQQVTSAVRATAAPVPAGAPVTPGAAAGIEQPPEAASQPRVDPPPLPQRGGPVERRRMSPTRAGSHAPPPAAERVNHTFLEALRLLQRSQRALEGGDVAFAMSLLDELDARFPAHMLAEERQVARALGWCALGDEAQAARVGGRLLLDNPQSIYATRLARSCARPGSGGAAAR